MRMFSCENITDCHNECFELVEMSYKCAELRENTDCSSIYKSSSYKNKLFKSGWVLSTHDRKDKNS